MKKLMMAVWAACLAGAILADSSYSFTYQAALRDEHGAVIVKDDQVVRSHTVTLRLWDSPAGGVLLWGRIFNIYTDATGLFNLEVTDAGGALADETPLCPTLEQVFVRQAAGDVYVGIEVKDSAGEIVPRQRLFAVPFAAVANDVRKISGDVAVGGKIAMGATGNVEVTADGIVQNSGQSTFQDVVANGTITAAGAMTAKGGLTVNGGTLAVKTDLELDSGRRLTVGGSEIVPVPVGGIIMWTQAALPDNEHWAVCDGSTQNGVKTPDLRSRFIVGAGSGYALGATGGKDSVTLTTSQMPSHRHYYVGDDQLAYIDSAYDCSTPWTSTTKGYDASSKLSGDSKVYRTNAVGGDQAHENRPPYYALYFIMRVK
ncbi:MAG: hypothetical protein ACI4RD_01385 [Kiritimatiellia bacterium]